MWSMASKIRFFHSVRMQYLVGKAITQFNFGYTRTLYENLGSVGKEIAMKHDKKKYFSIPKKTKTKRRKKRKEITRYEKKRKLESKGRYKL